MNQSQGQAVAHVPSPPQQVPSRYAGATEAQVAALTQACNALWAATLSLMVAFMQTQAPAHRYLMARKIARNFATLQEEECFTPESRESFARLAARWTVKADRLAPQPDRPHGGIRMLLPEFLR